MALSTRGAGAGAGPLALSLSPAPPRAPKQVLEEDAYTDALAAIIERDFFPHLARLRAQEEYLDALEKNDMVKLREITVRLAQSTQTPGGARASTASTAVATPRFGQTPGVNVRATPRGTPGPSSLPFAPPSLAVEGGQLVGGPTEVLAKAGIDPSISLGSFQAAYTSEDNASFEALVEKLNGEHRRRYHWLYDPSNMQVVLSGPAVPELAAGVAKAEDTAVVKAPLPPGEDVPAGEPKPLEHWRYRARNTFMYYPEGVDETSADRIAAANARPSVNFAAVRFSRSPFATASANPRDPSSRPLDGQALDSLRHLQEQLQRATAMTPSAAMMRSAPPDSPHVAGYGFVPATPSLVPGVDATPLMTWGAIEGTPLLLDPLGTPFRPGEPTYRMPPQDEREAVAKQLADKALKSARKSSAVARAAEAARRESPYARPASPAARLQTLSPAAARLLRHRTPGSLSAGADDELRATYSRAARAHGTPTATPPTWGTPKSSGGPSRRARSTPDARPAAHPPAASAQSPGTATAPAAPAASTTGTKSLTDDLLRL